MNYKVSFSELKCTVVNESCQTAGTVRHFSQIDQNCSWPKCTDINVPACLDQVSDDEILAANETYGSLGELAIMALPKSQVARFSTSSAPFCS